ncbi:MAG TPA: nucleotidyl transferase [candidate division Zixibacteria bacterium]|nr:nucleotidyl transferase [candidate division Zixibacteria bacterium]
MKAVIPVAGTGSRLRPLTLTMPKALVPVAGKPILGHILDKVVALDIQDVILIISPAGDAIKTYVEQYDLNVQYVVQQEALGIGHAIFQCRSLLDDEPILIILGDTTYSSDFSYLRTGLTTSAVGVKSLDGDLRRFGIVEVEKGRVTRLVEKPDHPQSNLVVAGVYYLNEPMRLIDCLDTMIRKTQTTRHEYQLTDALQMMIDQGITLTTFTVNEWHDCGTPDRLLEANRRLLDLKEDGGMGEIPGSVLIPPVAIAPDARIEASVIGPHAVVSGQVKQICVGTYSKMNI